MFHVTRPMRLIPVCLAAVVILGVGAATASAQAGGIPGVGEDGGPTNPLSPDDLATWLAGREIFDRNFNVPMGLGLPDFNADSCRACHSDPVMGGAGPLELNVSRFGHDGGGTEPFVSLPGGQAASRLRPPPFDTKENYPFEMPDPIDNADVFEQRQTPTLLGLGLVDTISDATILSNADPDDLDGDGIRGVARILTINGVDEVGRFGWKAQVPRLTDFVRDAMGQEMGITTPDDGRGFAVAADADVISDPELTPTDTDRLAFFLGNLGPPISHDTENASVKRGFLVFQALKCSVCHIPSLDSTLPNTRVALFSDLLLHDVQPPGFHGMAEPGAPSGMYRTPLLWGIGKTGPYLHDGRAETLEQAIAGHHNEAEFSSLGFAALAPGDRADLLNFLGSL